MLIGKIKSIVQFHPKKRLVNIDINGSVAKTYVVSGNINSKYWSRIKVGDMVRNLEWFDENSKIIDADSKPYIVE